MTLLELHTNWAWVVLISNALAGVWALSAHRWAPFRHQALWWLVIAAEIATFVQVIFGVILLSVQGIDAPEFHIFYGFLTLIAVAIMYGYRAQLKPHLYLLYGAGSLFIMGLAIRAMLLG